MGGWEGRGKLWKVVVFFITDFVLQGLTPPCKEIKKLDVGTSKQHNSKQENLEVFPFTESGPSLRYSASGFLHKADQ